MNTQPPDQTSAIEPRLQPDPSTDERFKIALWIGRYEGYLFNNAPESTYERYARILSKFYAYFPDKRFTYDFLRCHFEDYKNDRLKEGASPTTVAMELSVLRGFWRWMLRMNAEGVIFNPLVGIKIPRPEKQRPAYLRAERQNEDGLATQL